MNLVVFYALFYIDVTTLLVMLSLIFISSNFGPVPFKCLGYLHVISCERPTFIIDTQEV